MESKSLQKLLRLFVCCFRKTVFLHIQKESFIIYYKYVYARARGREERERERKKRDELDWDSVSYHVESS